MHDEQTFREHVSRLEALAPRLLGRVTGAGAAYADLFFERTRHHAMSLQQDVRGGSLRPARHDEQRRLDEGAALRGLSARRVGFGATADLTADALQRAAETAAAPFDGPDEAVPCRLPALEWARPLPPDAPDAASVREKRAMLQAAADVAFSADPSVCRVTVRFQDRVRRVAVANTEGVFAGEATMTVGLRVDVEMRGEQGPVHAYAVGGGAAGLGYFFEHRPEAIALEAVERARALAEARPLPRVGALPVVIAGGWGGVWLHEVIGHGLEADVAAADRSAFGTSLGEQVAPSGVTLIDDATRPGGRGSFVRDDEGTPGRRTVLIEDGRLVGLLTDRRHAFAAGRALTGNARRQDFRHAPLPRMTNLFMDPGATEPDDLVADVEEGLCVETVGHGQVHPDGGFAFDVVEGWWIEQGCKTHPVGPLRISGTGPETLRHIAGVGCDLRVETGRGQCEKGGQVVPVSVGMPTVLIRDLHVSGTV